MDGTDRHTKKGAQQSGAREGDGPIFEVEDGGTWVGTVRKPVGYEGAWHDGEGMGWEEINAEIREFRGHGDDEQAGWGSP